MLKELHTQLSRLGLLCDHRGEGGMCVRPNLAFSTASVEVRFDGARLHLSREGLQTRSVKYAGTAAVAVCELLMREVR